MLRAMSVIPGVDDVRGLEFSKPAGVAPTTSACCPQPMPSFRASDFFLFCGTGDGTQGLVCAKQSGPPLSSTSSPFYFYNNDILVPYMHTESTAFLKSRDLGSIYGS